MGVKGQRVGNVRVSCVDRNADRQLELLDADRVFTDRAPGRDTARPQLQALLAYVREGDTIIVQSMDRLARNVDDLRTLVQQQAGRGVRVQFLKENLTFTGDESPLAHLMLSVLGAVAQFKRDLIKERQREGIALARRHGAYRGRKKALDDDKAAEHRRRVAAGEPKSGLARDLGISRETLYRYLRQEVGGRPPGASIVVRSAPNPQENRARE